MSCIRSERSSPSPFIVSWHVEMLLCVVVEFENAETLLISEVQMLLEHRYDVK